MFSFCDDVVCLILSNTLFDCFSESDDEDRLKKGGKDGLDPETVDALGEFSFLKEDKPSIGSAKKRVESSDEWSVNQSAINQMKEKFRYALCLSVYLLFSKLHKAFRYLKLKQDITKFCYVVVFSSTRFFPRLIKSPMRTIRDGWKGKVVGDAVQYFF